MQKSRIKKTGYNITAMALFEAINFAYQLILPGLIIRTYGSAYNGLASSITQFLRYIQILTLGVAGPTRVALYRALAKNDHIEISAVVNAHSRYMRRVGIALVGYIAVLCVAYPLLTKEQFTTREIVFLTIAIGVHSLAAYFYGITYSTLLTADQRQYIYNIFKSGITAATIIVSVILIKTRFSLQVVKLSSGLLFLVGLVFLNQWVRKKYRIDKKVLPDMSALSQRRDAMGHSIANIVHDSTDVAVLTVLCNTSIVSVYSVYHIIMNGLKQLQNIFTVGIEAVFGSMIARGEDQKLRQSLSCFEFLIGIFVSVVFSTAGVLTIPFVKLYVKGVTDVNYVIPAYAAVIVTAQAFYSLRTPYLTLVQAAGHYKQTRNGAFLEAGINIVSSVILTLFMGIVGTAIGTLLANVFRTAQYLVYAHMHLLKREISLYIKRFLWILGSAGLTVLLTLNPAQKYAVSWMSWGACGVVVVIISTFICTLSGIVLFGNDFRYVLLILKRALNRKKKSS